MSEPVLMSNVREFVSVNTHNEAMKRLEAENDRQNHRIDELEKNVKEIGKLTISVERLAVSMETMAEEQKEQGVQLKELQSRDGEMFCHVYQHDEYEASLAPLQNLKRFVYWFLN